MKLKLRQKYDTPIDRLFLAKYLGRIINGTNFKPYPKNGEELDFGWELDPASNWSLWFDRENTSIIQLVYRCKRDYRKAEKKLFDWLAIKIPSIQKLKD